MGWHLHRAGHLLVDRRNPGADIVQKMARLVGERSSLIVFPEGTRSVDGAVGALQEGIVSGRDRRAAAGRAGEHRRQPPRHDEGPADGVPGRRAATIHAPIRPPGSRREDVMALAERVRSIVAVARRKVR